MATLSVDEAVLSAWLQCERRAWLQARGGARARPSGLTRHLAEQRADVRRLLAAQWAGDAPRRPSGTGVTAAAAATRQALLGGAPLLLDPTFALQHRPLEDAPALRLTVRLDAARCGRDGCDLMVVAAGKRVRPRQLQRLALAWLAASRAGVTPHRALVLRVAAAGADVRLQAVDVTERCRQLAGRLPDRLEALAASLAAPAEPRTVVGRHCRRPAACPFQPHCWAGDRDQTVYHVRGLSASTRRTLRAAGWLRLSRLPRDAPGLGEAEREAVQDAREGRLRVEPEGLRLALAQLRPPVAYLDLEFATTAVPLVAGAAPFEPLPFQFSLHLEGRDGTVARFEYLQRAALADPRPPLAAALAPALGAAATVVVYDAGAERALLRGLAAVVPSLAGPLTAAEERFWDLHQVVRRHLRHPAFGSGWGLKHVAAVLAPDCYRGVALQDGLEAQAQWRRLLRARAPGPAEALAGGLLDYCRADSRAMLETVRALRQLAGGAGGRPG